MRPLHVVLITTDRDTARLVEALLGAATSGFTVQVLREIAIVKARVAGGGVDAVLAHVSADGASGVVPGDLRTLGARVNPPVIALCASRRDLGEQAVRNGARAWLTEEGYAELPSKIRAIASGTEAQPQARGGGHGRAGVISIWGAKGGVGATTVGLNVAAVLAANRNVVLAELRPPLGTLFSYFRPKRTMPDLGTLFRERLTSETVSAALWSLQNRPHLRILFAPSDLERDSEIRPDQVGVLIEQLSGQADVVVVDIGLSLSHPACRQVLRTSDRLAVVVDREPMSVELAKLALAAAAKHEVAPPSISLAVVNRTVVPCPVPIPEIEGALKLPVASVIAPAPELCITAQLQHEPLVTWEPESTVAKSLEKLAHCLET